ncbi:MAG: hypothetical protein ACI80V_002940 [Rhodothermales bacterium]|jgi:hypothetical protein
MRMSTTRKAVKKRVGQKAISKAAKGDLRHQTVLKEEDAYVIAGVLASDGTINDALAAAAEKVKTVD